MFKSISYVLRKCFKITLSAPTKYQRGERLFAHIICLLIMAVLAALTAWFALPCVGYLFTSGLKHLGNYMAQGDDWAMYSIGNELKKMLIENCDVAHYLHSCAGSNFGKFMQVLTIILGNLIFLIWSNFACKFCVGLFQVVQEMLLLKFRNSWYYIRTLDNFLEEIRYKSVTYRNTVTHRLYPIFSDEKFVIALVSKKYERQYPKV